MCGVLFMMGKNLNGAKLVKKGIRNSKLKKKLGEVCVYCGCTNKLILTIDHIKPLVRGGDDTDENKQVACVICNWLKGSLTDAEFKKYYKLLLTMKDLNKVKLSTGDLSIFFRAFGYPKSLKDIVEDNR